MGNTLVAVVLAVTTAGASYSVADDKGSYAPGPDVTRTTHGGSGGFYLAEIWSAPVTTGGTVAVTATETGVDTDAFIALGEFSGIDLTNPELAENFKVNPSGTTHGSGDISPTANCVIIGTQHKLQLKSHVGWR